MEYLYFWIMLLPNDDVIEELHAFFFKYFSPKYFEKKCNRPRKRHLYFQIMVLPYDDVFGELCGFFFKISRSRSQGISQFLFQPNDSSWVTFVLAQSCVMQRNAAQISVFTNYGTHWQALTNCAAPLVETRLKVNLNSHICTLQNFKLGLQWCHALQVAF